MSAEGGRPARSSRPRPVPPPPPRYQQFKDFQRRILVATNLFGRGMDIERVNIVFNCDMPEDSDTYLHWVSGPTPDTALTPP